MGRDAGAGERLLQERPVLSGRPEQHRHPVERDPAAGLAADQAGDLDALAALAGSGEDQHVVAEGSDGRRARHEEPLLYPLQRGLRRFLQRARGDPERAREWLGVRGRSDGEEGTAESRDESLLQRGAQRKIEERRRKGEQLGVGLEGEAEDLRAIGEARPPELGLVRFERPPQIARRPRTGHAQFLEAARERAGQAGLPRHAVELPQPPAKLMDDARAHRLHAQGRQR